jgi:hypothetical protein
VEMKFGDGLPEGIDIKIGCCSYRQGLDYVKIPFRCTICHLYGHLCRGCPKKNTPHEEFIMNWDMNRGLNTQLGQFHLVKIRKRIIRRKKTRYAYNV